MSKDKKESLIDRVNNIISKGKVQNKEDVYKKDEDLDKVSGDIVLKNVTFGYSKLEDPLIKKFNLTIIRKNYEKARKPLAICPFSLWNN